MIYFFLLRKTDLRSSACNLAASLRLFAICCLVSCACTFNLISFSFSALLSLVILLSFVDARVALLYLFLKTFSRAIYNYSHFFFKRCVDGKFSSEEKVIWISDEERETDEETEKEISDEETEKVNNCCCCSRSSSSRAGVHA